MKNEYQELHEEFKKLDYYLDLDDPIKWYKNIKIFFDSFFSERFGETKKLGNTKIYQNFEAIYKLLLSDFGGLCLESNLDFKEYQLQLLKSIKKSNIDIEDFNGILNLSQNFFNQSVFYQLILVSTFIFRLSNIESIQTKEFYRDLKEFRKALFDNFSNMPKPIIDLDKKILIAKIRKAKDTLRSKNLKPTKLKVAQLLKIPKTNFYEDTKNIPFESL